MITLKELLILEKAFSLSEKERMAIWDKKHIRLRNKLTKSVNYYKIFNEADTYLIMTAIKLLKPILLEKKMEEALG